MHCTATSIDAADISIIIPVINESEQLHACLQRLKSHQYLSTAEVIICDGGSQDNLLGVVKDFDCHLVQTRKGRAVQMNAGSQMASKQYLLFLHVDTSLPQTFAFYRSDKTGDTDTWGFFRVKLSGHNIAFRWIESFMNWRSGLTQIGTGDQTLYFHHSLFETIGRFPDIPIMEDVAICKLARDRSPPSIITCPVTTSSRRWETNGIIKTVLTMWGLRFAYWLGVSPDKLHRLYYPNL